MALILSFAGCGEPALPSSTEQPLQGNVPQTLTFNAKADSFVSSTWPNSVQADVHIDIGLDPLGEVSRALVSFNDTAVKQAVGSRTIESARLEFDVSWSVASATSNVTLHRLSTNWVEANATWNCANDTSPNNLWIDCTTANTWVMGTSGTLKALVEPAIATTPVGSGTTLGFDVTNDVKGWLNNTLNNRGWGLKMQNEPYGQTMALAARESGKPPRLIVKLAGACKLGDPNSGGCGKVLSWAAPSGARLPELEDPIPAAQSLALSDPFSWSNVPPVVEEYQGRPTLWYTLVYIEDTFQIEALDYYKIDYDFMPFFREERTKWAGKKGYIPLKGDGRGLFAFAIMAGEMYNALRTTALENPNEVPFRAVVMRQVPVAAAKYANGSLSYEYLSEHGYLYRGIEGGTGSNAVSGQQQALFGAGIAGRFFGALGNLGERLVDRIANGIGNLRELFKGKADLDLYVYADNPDPAFNVKVANSSQDCGAAANGFNCRSFLARGWGKDIGEAIPMAGVEMRVSQGAIGWSLNKANTDGDGHAHLRVISGVQAETCMNLSNTAAEVTHFLTEMKICDFGFPEIKANDLVGSNNQYLVRVNDDWAAALSEITDGRDYVKNVIGMDMRQARVLVGGIANAFGGAMTPCLDFPNWRFTFEAELLGLPFLSFTHPDIVLGGDETLSRGITVHEYGHYVMCNMIYDNGPGSRIEFGNTWTKLIQGEVLRKHKEKCESCYIAEGWADFFAAQIVGGTNYFGLSPKTPYQWAEILRTASPVKYDPSDPLSDSYPQSWISYYAPAGGDITTAPGVKTTVALRATQSDIDDDDYSGTGPMFWCRPDKDICFDDNVGGSKSGPFPMASNADAIGDRYRRLIAKVMTLLHDVVDGQPVPAAGVSVPGNGGAWFARTGANVGVMDTDATEAWENSSHANWFNFGHQADESVALPGDVIRLIIQKWSDRANKFTEKDFFKGISDALQAKGVPDAEICKLFALHNSDGLCPSYLPVAANVVPGLPTLTGVLTPDANFSPDIKWTFSSDAPFAQTFEFQIINVTTGATIQVGSTPFSSDPVTLPTNGLAGDTEVTAKLRVVNGTHASGWVEYTLVTPAKSPQTMTITTLPGRTLVSFPESQASSYALELMVGGRWEAVRNFPDASGSNTINHTLWALPGVLHTIRVVGVNRAGERGLPSPSFTFTPIPPKELYVSAASGDDAHASAGERAHPFKTLNNAWAKVRAQRICPAGTTGAACATAIADWVAVRINVTSGTYSTSAPWEQSHAYVAPITIIHGGFADGTWQQTTSATIINAATGPVAVKSCTGNQDIYASFTTAGESALLFELVQVEASAAPDQCQAVVAANGGSIGVRNSQIRTAGAGVYSSCRMGISLYDAAATGSSPTVPFAKSKATLEVSDHAEVLGSKLENEAHSAFYGICAQAISSVAISDSTVAAVGNASTASNDAIVAGLVLTSIDDVAIGRSTISSFKDTFTLNNPQLQAAAMFSGVRNQLVHNSVLRTGGGGGARALIAIAPTDGIVNLTYVNAIVGSDWGLTQSASGSASAVATIVGTPKKLTIANSVLAYAGGKTNDMTILDLGEMGAPSREFVKGVVFSLEDDTTGDVWSAARCAPLPSTYKRRVRDDWEYGNEPKSYHCGTSNRSYDVSDNVILTAEPCNEWPSPAKCEIKQAADGLWSYEVAHFDAAGRSLISGGAVRCAGVNLSKTSQWDIISRDIKGTVRPVGANDENVSAGAFNDTCRAADQNVILF